IRLRISESGRAWCMRAPGESRTWLLRCLSSRIESARSRATLSQSALRALFRAAKSFRSWCPAWPVRPPLEPRPDARAPESTRPRNTRSRCTRARLRRKDERPPHARLPAGFRRRRERRAPGCLRRPREFSCRVRIFPWIGGGPSRGLGRNCVSVEWPSVSPLNQGSSEDKAKENRPQLQQHSCRKKQSRARGVGSPQVAPTSALLEPPGNIIGMLCQDNFSPGPLDSGHYFQHNPRLVNPAVASRRLHHGVLAAHIVGGHRHVEPFANPLNNIEIG